MQVPAPPTPQVTGGYFAKYGLIRPRKGGDRKIVGVGAAIGRATGTDPLLWRVLLAVAVIFAGVGAFLYLLGWLLLPQEGDQASPAESLAGRGTSSTRRGLTIALVVVAAMFGGGVIFGNDPWAVFMLGVLAVVVFIALRDREGESPAPATGIEPRSTEPGHAAPHPSEDGPNADAKPDTVLGDAEPEPRLGDAEPEPRLDDLTAQARQELMQRTYGMQLPPLAEETAEVQYAPFTPQPEPAKPPKERSALALLTCSLTLLVLGMMAIVDVAGAPISWGAYAATALLVTGAGVLLSTWFGRSRWLIVLGVLLSLMVAGDVTWRELDVVNAGYHEWHPQTVSQIEPEYKVVLGQGIIDLTEVAFSDFSDVDVRAETRLGQITIKVPPEVDVVATVTVDYGNAHVLAEEDSFTGYTRTITDNGADGPGGGTVNLDADVYLGELRVVRP